MNDTLIAALWVVFLILALAVVLALASRNPLAWLREEWRLMRADTWAAGPSKIVGATAEEERAKILLHRQRALAKHMRRKGKHLFAGKRYRPALTAPVAPATPPRADVVVPMRKQR